ncbi:MAG: hypothetical protein ABI950_07400 [Solirubrobacteraceae bacterium]
MRRCRILLSLLLGLVALAAPAAHAATDPGAITAGALAGVMALQRDDGLFTDPTGRLVGSGGLPTLAFGALHADDDDAAARLSLARATLARGSGATVILRWPLAMIAADELSALPSADRTELRGRIASWATLHAAGIADRCYRQASCFNNYKLADAVLNLELARSGVRSATPGTRLHDPVALRRRALAWLEGALPAAAPATATVMVPGRHAEPATILSDPGTLPLAYAALCTAWAVRATALAAPAAAPRLRLLTRRALWGLVGVAAPDGEISWSGRGQDQVWSLAATRYAAAAGNRQFASSDPVLAARLRRLADVELDALAGRLHDGALQVLPAGNDQLSGLDHYYSAVGSTGLALTWLELARDALPDPSAPRLALPSEIDRASFSDPARSGLLARRVGATWMGLRLRRVHSFDPRDDFGLARVLRRGADGWHEQRPERPAPAGKQRAPGAGPLLVQGGRQYWPAATAWRPIAGGVELSGAWHARDGRSRPARWRVTASAAGVALGTACARGSAVQVTEWLPRRGRLERGERFAARAGYRVRASTPLTLRPLATRYANARQPSLAGVRVVVACRRPWTILRWSGGAVATG